MCGTGGFIAGHLVKKLKGLVHLLRVATMAVSVSRSFASVKRGSTWVHIANPR